MKMKHLVATTLALIVALPLCLSTPVSARSKRSDPKTVSGLVRLEAVKRLPPPAGAKAISGSSRTQFEVGVIKSAKEWRTFAAKASSRFQKLRVNWAREMVVYVVFTGQTNALSFRRWVAPRGGRAELHLAWSGIEPYYLNATPGVFRVVNRSGVRSIVVKTTATHPSYRIALTVPIK